MNRSLQIVLLIVGMLFAGHALAQVLRTAGNEAFCRDKSDFPEYLAVVNNNKFNYHTVKGCMELRKGIRYRVIEQHPDGINKIHLYPPQGPADGYIMGEMK
jgi:hypothetical protein